MQVPEPPSIGESKDLDVFGDLEMLPLQVPEPLPSIGESKDLDVLGDLKILPLQVPEPLPLHWGK